MTGCQVCGAQQSVPFVTQGAYRWCRCADCGLVFLQDMPSDAEARDLQNDEVSAGYIASYLKRADKKLARSLRRARRLKRLMPGPALIDIGSNLGFLVEAARQSGLQPVGVELNPALAAAARARFPDCTFLTGALEEQDFAGRLFDGAYCSEVIEHVPECRRLLTRIAEVLRPGGVLYLTTPHIREYTKGRDPVQWRNFGAPDHKLYFDDSTIRRLLLSCGFGEVRIEFSFFRGIKLFARRVPAAA